RLEPLLLGDEFGPQRELALARRLEVGDDGVESLLRRGQLGLGGGQLGLRLPQLVLLLGEALALHLQGVEERVELAYDVGVLPGEQPHVVVPGPQLREAAAAREREERGRAALLVEGDEHLADPRAHLAQAHLETGDALLGLPTLLLELADPREDPLALAALLGELGADAVALLDALLELGGGGAQGRLDLGQLLAPLGLELLVALYVRLELTTLRRVEHRLAGGERPDEQGGGQESGETAPHCRSRRNCERPMALPTKPTSTASAASAPAIQPSRAGSRTNGTNVNCSERRAMPNW